MRVEKPLRGASPVPSKAGHAPTDNDDHGDGYSSYDSRHGSAVTAATQCYRCVLATVQDLHRMQLVRFARVHVIQHQRA